MKKSLFSIYIMVLISGISPFAVIAQSTRETLVPPFQPLYLWGISTGFNAGYLTGLKASSHPLLSIQHYPAQIVYGYWTGIFFEYPLPGLTSMGTALTWSDSRTVLDHSSLLWTTESLDTVEGTRRAFLYLGLPGIELYTRKRLRWGGGVPGEWDLRLGVSLGFPIVRYYEEVYTSDSMSIPGFSSSVGIGHRTEEQSLAMPVQWHISAGLHYDIELLKWRIIVGKQSGAGVRIRSGLSFHYGLSDLSGESDSFHYLRYGISVVVPLGWGYIAPEELYPEGDY